MLTHIPLPPGYQPPTPEAESVVQARYPNLAAVSPRLLLACQNALTELNTVCGHPTVRAELQAAIRAACAGAAGVH